MSTTPANPLTTVWGENLESGGEVLGEYPRPGLVRPRWLNLNGLWEYAIVSDPTPDVAADGEILVPFCLESILSKVAKNLPSDKWLVYRREFQLPTDWTKNRIRINFEAVDYEAEVLVNGRPVGSHRGGYDAFSFDITDQLNLQEEKQSLVVYVKDPTEKQAIPLGKQWSSGDRANRFIFYEATSGIWQAVWIEPVSRNFLESVKINTDIDKRVVSLELATGGEAAGEVSQEVVVRVLLEDEEVAQGQGKPGDILAIGLGDSMKTWSHISPTLYDLEIELWENGKLVDAATSYFGMRKIEIRKVNGSQRVFLNNQLLRFQVGPLDQGYWPDGLLTAPADPALVWDIQMSKDLGFNMIRKHIKIESRRWYYWADKLGILIWQDFPAVSDVFNMEILPKAQENFRREYRLWMKQLHNHPSIILWVVFNEAWGQHNTIQVTEDVMSADPSRLVTGASGWHDHPVGHVADVHPYPGPTNGGTVFPAVDEKRIAVVGEMWGQSRIIPGHNWFGDPEAKDDPRGGVKTEEEFLARYKASVDELETLIDSRAYTAAVYTQLTDVEGELNGFFTYDRKEVKADIKKIAELNKRLW